MLLIYDAHLIHVSFEREDDGVEFRMLRNNARALEAISGYIYKNVEEWSNGNKFQRQ